MPCRQIVWKKKGEIVKFSFVELIRKISSKSWEPRVRKHFYIFLLCLGISIFIWLMIKLSSDYYANLSYKIEYTNIPVDQLLAPGADSLLSINIEAQGFKLFSLKYLRTDPTIEIDLRKKGIHKNRYTYGYYILASTLRNKLEQELKLTDESFSIYPDTLNFILEELMTKYVAVKPEINFRLRKQHQLKGEIRIQPDSILVSGIPSVLDTLSFVRTQARQLGEIDKSMSFQLGLENFSDDKKIKLGKDTVRIEIPVVKYTETSLKIPIDKPEGMNEKVKFFPAQVEVFFLVSLNDYDKIDQDMFTAGTESIKDIHGKNTLQVILTHTPNFVKVIRIKPEKVEFIILK